MQNKKHFDNTDSYILINRAVSHRLHNKSKSLAKWSQKETIIFRSFLTGCSFVTEIEIKGFIQIYLNYYAALVIQCCMVTDYEKLGLQQRKKMWSFSGTRRGRTSSCYYSHIISRPHSHIISRPQQFSQLFLKYILMFKTY